MTLIKNVLQPADTVLRKNSEDVLVSLRNDKPNELMNAYLEILKSKHSSRSLFRDPSVPLSGLFR